MSEPSSTRRPLGRRVSDDERQACADALAEAFTSGRLSRDEFDTRLEDTWSSVTDVDLARLVSDLDPQTVPQNAAVAVPASRQPPAVVSLTPLGVAKVTAFELALAGVAFVVATMYGTADWPLIAIFLWAFGSIAGAAGAALSRPKQTPPTPE